MRPALLALALCLAAAAARADEDPNAIARDLSARFEATCEKGDPAGALALYVDDASAVYPAERAHAEGRTELARVLDQTCAKGRYSASRFVGGRARFVGKDAIAASGEWETTAPGPDGRPAKVLVRTTELLVRTPSGWRYLMDHASIGVPLPAPVPGPK